VPLPAESSSAGEQLEQAGTHCPQVATPQDRELRLPSESINLGRLKVDGGQEGLHIAQSPARRFTRLHYLLLQVYEEVLELPAAVETGGHADQAAEETAEVLRQVAGRVCRQFSALQLPQRDP